MSRLDLARIRRGDDHAHRFLIKPFEAALALQIFQMTPDRTITQKTFGLRRRDETRRKLESEELDDSDLQGRHSP